MACNLLLCGGKISSDLDCLSSKPYLDPPVSGGGRRGLLLSKPQSEERLRSTGLQSKKPPPNFHRTRCSANRNHLGVSHLSANRWSLQIQTQILTPHFSNIYWPPRKPGLQHKSKSRLDVNSTPIKSHSKIQDWGEKKKNFPPFEARIKHSQQRCGRMRAHK